MITLTEREVEDRAMRDDEIAKTMQRAKAQVLAELDGLQAGMQEYADEQAEDRIFGDGAADPELEYTGIPSDLSISDIVIDWDDLEINGVPVNYSFMAKPNDANNAITIQAGEVLFGPATWITPSITAADVTSAAPIGWLKLTVGPPGSEAAAWSAGTAGDFAAALAGLADNEVLVKIVTTTWAAGVLTNVSNNQCGDIKIPRAAGG